VPYYRGDYYRGDYYRGDPFLGVLAGMAGRAVGRLAGKAGQWVGRQVAGTGRSVVKQITGGAIPGTIAGTIGVSIGKRLGQPTEMMPIPSVGGMAFGGKKRYRRMNPLNPKALRRALRRAEGFEKFARKTVSGLRYGAKKFKSTKRAS